MSKEENKGNKAKPCNHFMVWNIQGGYSYYRCDKCNYIDGKKTFEAQKQELLKELNKIEIPYGCLQVKEQLEKFKQLLK